MQPVTVRAASPVDFVSCSALWLESMILLQQMDARVQLLPDARVQWIQAAHSWLSDPKIAVLVAASDEQIDGYVVGRIVASPAGFAPAEMGVVSEFVVEAHQQSHGVGPALLDHICDWFRSHQLLHITVHVAARGAVDQAFWRAQGATDWTRQLWLTL